MFILKIETNNQGDPHGVVANILAATLQSVVIPVALLHYILDCNG